MPLLTPQELDAISVVKQSFGAAWKSKLRQFWATGAYPARLSEDQKAHLQSVRNKVGPSGLSKL